LPLNFFSSSLTSLTWIFLKALRRRYGTWITTAFLFPATSIWLQSHDKHHHQRSHPYNRGNHISTSDTVREETGRLHSIVDVEVLEVALELLVAVLQVKESLRGSNKHIRARRDAHEIRNAKMPRREKKIGEGLALCSPERRSPRTRRARGPSPSGSSSSRCTSCLPFAAGP
jgi:hypothetical protein